MDIKISAAVITTNNEDTIKKTMDSLSWVDEIVVVDGFSTDSTPKIVNSYEKVSFHERKFMGHVEQKNYALSLSSNDWVMCIDSDEEVSNELKEQILDFLGNIKSLNSNGKNYVACRFPRHSFHLGKWIDHGGWYPDRKIRFLNKNFGKWAGVNPHDIIEVQGDILELNGELVHYSFKDLFDQIKTNNYLSSAAANAFFRKKVNFSIFRLLGKPMGKFLETYVVKKGFMDGMPGFIISVGAAYSMFLKYAKLWELYNLKEPDKDDEYPVDKA